MQYYEYWLVGGIPTPLKNMKVSWDDDIPNIWKVIKFMFQTTNQIIYIYIYTHYTPIQLLCLKYYESQMTINIINPKWLWLNMDV